MDGIKCSIKPSFLDGEVVRTFSYAYGSSFYFSSPSLDYLGLETRFQFFSLPFLPVRLPVSAGSSVRLVKVSTTRSWTSSRTPSVSAYLGKYRK